MPIDGADMTLIEDEIPIAVIDTTSNAKSKITLQLVYCQSETYVVKDNEYLQEGAVSAPTIEEYLRQLAMEPF